MRFSQQKSLLFKSSVSPKKALKQPKQLITKLNTDIETIQNSIIHYNEMEKRSANWKQQMNFTVYNCQLKALSQPKLQNILLQSNFINNMAIFGKNMNESAVKNSAIKLKNGKNKNYMINSSGLGFRKTMSMKVDGSYNNNRKMNDQNEMRKSQKFIGGHNQSRAHGQFVEENPELSFVNARPQFNSFREEISKNNSNKKIVSKKSTNDRLGSKGKISEFRGMNKTLEKCPSKNMNSDSNVAFDQYFIKDNQTIIDDEAQSIMMQTSTRIFSQQFDNPKNKSLLNANNIFSKQLGLIPISQQKMITLSSQRKSKTIRQQIQEKTMRLEKQWLLTECYREKFNIMPNTTKEQSRVTQTSQNKVKRSLNKLANIIHKVQQRRPSTSLTQQRTQNSRQTTLAQDIVKQKSNTIQMPEFNNESIHFNISTFGF